jgi:hypothetical protein
MNSTSTDNKYVCYSKVLQTNYVILSLHPRAENYLRSKLKLIVTFSYLRKKKNYLLESFEHFVMNSIEAATVAQMN